MRQIVVLGCGFAGYHAARRIEKELTGRRRVQLTVVTRRAHFVFTPLLPGVASGELEANHIITPVDEAFSARTEVIIDEVEDIDFAKRHLVGTREKIPFDYLLIATGSVRDEEAFDGASKLVGPSTLTDATAIRRDLLELCATGDRPLRFALIGGSTSGVEWAAELATGLRIDHGLTPEGGDVEIALYEKGDRLLPDHSEQVSQLAARVLDGLGVQTHLEQRIQRVEAEKVHLDDGSSYPHSMAFHCAGRRGISLWSQAAPKVDDLDRIEVDDTLAITEVPGVYVAGDAAAPLSDVPTRSNPQIALQQGRWAARNLLADMSGRMKKPFQYEDRGDFVTLGRNDAALEMRGLLLEGKAAWLAYRLYYTALIPRPIQKARLMMDWIASRMAANDSPAPALLEEHRENKNGAEDDSSTP